MPYLYLTRKWLLLFAVCLFVAFLLGGISHDSLAQEPDDENPDLSPSAEQLQELKNNTFSDIAPIPIPDRQTGVPTEDGVVAPSTSVSNRQTSSEVVNPLATPLPTEEAGIQAFSARGAAPVRLLIEFEAPPTATSGSAESIESSQEAFLRELSGVVGDFEVIKQLYHVLNGVIVDADPTLVASIRAMPGVKDVYFDVMGELNNDRSVQFIGAPYLWDLGYAGSEIDIAIIDSGIDYTHYDFNDTARADEPDTLGDWPAFPNDKVVGGYDYWGNGVNAPGTPDADPMDCNGHGTHVAGTAGGYGVLKDGTTYSGTYDLNTHTSNTFNVDATTTTPIAPNQQGVGPGVAPRANLWAFRIGGCGPAVSFIAAVSALEDVMDPNGDLDTSDHLDVVNMSFGGSYGDGLSDGFIIDAVNNAGQIGVIMVGSAGNSGDSYYINGAPNVADWVISVAAAESPHPRASSFGGFPLNYDELAFFTSRGPRRGDTFLKPDITAPGFYIFSACADTAGNPAYCITPDNHSAGYAGTSMASPHVTGAMALLREYHPTWNVAQLKALAMNTVLPGGMYDDITGLQASPSRVGTGMISIESALSADVIAYWQARPELVNVSFGLVDVLTSQTITETIELYNDGVVSVTYDVGFQLLTDTPGATITLSTNTVTVPPNETATVDVTFDVPDADALFHTHDATVSETQLGVERHWLAEEQGYVNFTNPTSGPPLRVAVHAAPRPISDMSAVIPLLVGPTIGASALPLQGEDVTSSYAPYDPYSVVSAYEWIFTDDNEYDGFDQFGFGLVESADLQHIGVTTDYPAVLAGGGTLADSTLYFGLTTYEDWASFSEEIWFVVEIDVDGDLAGDYQFINWNLGAPFGDDSNDVYIVMDNNTGTIIDYVNEIPGSAIAGGGPETRLMNTNMATFPIPVDYLGLTEGAATFNFYVTSCYFLYLCVDDSGVWLSYDAENPRLTFSDEYSLNGGPYAGFPWWLDFNGDYIPVSYDMTGVTAGTEPSVLLFHHYNGGPDSRPEIVQLQLEAGNDLEITKTVSNSQPPNDQAVFYTITVINSGPVDAVGVTVTDPIPAGLTFTQAVASQGSYDPATGIWTAGNLLVGQSATLRLYVRINPSQVGAIITNTATVSSISFDHDTANNTASVDLTVDFPVNAPGAEAGGEPQYISKTVDKSLATIGDTLTYTITYRNPQGNTLNSVVISDTFDSRFDNVHVVGNTLGTAVVSGNTVTVQGFSLAPGQSGTLVVTARISSRAHAGDVITNVATLESPDASIHVSNTVAVTIIPGSLPATGERSRSDRWLLLPFVALAAAWFVVRRRRKLLAE